MDDAYEDHILWWDNLLAGSGWDLRGFTGKYGALVAKDDVYVEITPSALTLISDMMNAKDK